MTTFSPPPFLPDRLIRGGHLQTLASLRMPRERIEPDASHVVGLPDGDAIVLHENVAVDGGADGKVMLLFHGLSGCHGSPYMIRLASRFARLGWTVYRVDMRGCGAAWKLARHLSHAGRSEDVGAAIEFAARAHPNSPLAAIAVSLGGNQLLRYVGRVGAALDPRPDWFDRLVRIGVVAPPIDLVRCSENMERRSRRLYNHFFIRTLFDRVAPGVRQQDGFQQVLTRGRPRTLLQLDDRITAPLSGFDDAAHYYQTCGAAHVVGANPVSTLLLAADDDPIVPAGCFKRSDWPKPTRVLITATGGHAGFIARGGIPWMDECLVAWMHEL